MVNLTFGEQVKIILGRKGMTIKELAELVEQHTGKPMSRQNMTQRLGRDNFQEKDMRLIAEILGCKFQLSIMEMDEVLEQSSDVVKEVPKENVLERDITVGELIDMTMEVEEPKSVVTEPEAVEEESEVMTEEVGPEEPETLVEPVVQEEQKKDLRSEEKELLRKGIRGYFRKPTQNVVQVHDATETKKEGQTVVGDVNPYTGKEYKTNSVRMHPNRIGYVQVYDQEQHKWIDMTEWAFIAGQERKKRALGKNYEPPIYLD